MTLPGHTITVGERAPANIAERDTGAWFVAGRTERGDHTAPQLCRSLSQFVTKMGDRYAGDPTLYDAADVFFREGGSILYVGRVVGDVPVKATADIVGAAAAVVAVATAKSVGEWGNDIDLVINETSGSFTVSVQYASVEVENSGSLATIAELIAWAEANSAYVDIANGTGADPVDGTASLATGDDDDDTIGDDNWVDALDLFTDDFGPGQVSAPGRTTTQGYADLMAHADAHKRVALLDGADTATVATLTAAAGSARGDDGERFSGLFAPWAVVPGLAAGTTRTVPYSAVQAGLMARSDAQGNNPNRAAAGVRGIARYAIALSQAAWTDADRETLNDAGVNVALIRRDEVRTMGDRTLVSPDTDPNWIALSNSRLVMAVAHKAGEVMERFEFEQIDGRKFKLGELQGDIRGQACMPFYLADALYGRTPDEAFSVNTGADVNPEEQLAAGHIKAVIVLRVSPRGETLETEIVRIPITEAIA